MSVCASYSSRFPHPNHRPAPFNSHFVCLENFSKSSRRQRFTGLSVLGKINSRQDFTALFASVNEAYFSRRWHRPWWQWEKGKFFSCLTSKKKLNLRRQISMVDFHIRWHSSLTNFFPHSSQKRDNFEHAQLMYTTTRERTSDAATIWRYSMHDKFDISLLE